MRMVADAAVDGGGCGWWWMRMVVDADGGVCGCRWWWMRMRMVLDADGEGRWVVAWSMTQHVCGVWT